MPVAYLYVLLLQCAKNMTTQKETQLMLQNKELKKENLRLVKKVAKLEVQLLTAKRHETQIRKFTTPKGYPSEKDVKKALDLAVASIAKRRQQLNTTLER